MKNILPRLRIDPQRLLIIFLLISRIISCKIFVHQNFFGYLFLFLKLTNFYGMKLIGQEVGSINFRKIKHGCFAMLAMPFLNNACLFGFDGFATNWKCFFYLSQFFFYLFQAASGKVSFKLFLNFSPLRIRLPPMLSDSFGNDTWLLPKFCNSGGV